jgi:hypothetical protein
MKPREPSIRFGARLVIRDGSSWRPRFSVRVTYANEGVQHDVYEGDDFNQALAAALDVADGECAPVEILFVEGAHRRTAP